MSKKKDKKIKRLQCLPIWPKILEMILTELIIFALSVFISLLAAYGVINSIVIQNVKECRLIVQSVNKNWNNESREQIKSRLSAFAASYDDISEIFIDDGKEEDFYLTRHSGHFEAEELDFFNTKGALHFFDPDSKGSYVNLVFRKEGIVDEEVEQAMEEESETKDFLYNPKRIFKSFDVMLSLTDDEFFSWASKESLGLQTISLYKTAIPDVNLGFKNYYKLNSFQFNLLVTIVVFLLVVLIFSGIYEITKVVNLVHERKRVNKLVTTDTITGGYNKEYFIRQAGKEISRGRRNYAVVQIRLEKYRNYCTAYGVKQGENLLEELNADMVSLLNKKEFVAHVEKSDFVLLLNYMNDEILNLRVRNIMNILRERRGGQHLTFSVGICPVKSKTDDVSLLLTCAGLAIPKEIKIQDEIVWFNDSMKEEQVWERRIEDDMDKALENHEFQVYLQPKYSTKKEVLSAAEALVRWIHPILGFISPGKFIPIFEKNGFILQLDDYMLTEVSKLQSEWMLQGRKLVPISVNVSRAHFAEENLAEHICQIVDEYKVPHEYIELELTESAFFDDKNVLLTTVRKLKDAGFKVSMDDFGAGYSSLNSLKELPLDIIKLDAEFFRSVDDVERSNLIVGQTISLAKKLGMEIVAEGIETREQVDFLAKQNCDLIQGFYFSKPLPVSEFIEKAYPKA